ncbi:dystrotelin-like [Trichogramma pretiosum]|uniref:dystrotelin-like n=1 Tax=Trichogramma pretiosum TaxID=7493 RepID=UPI0006C98E0A|nr:dystrotelin-like [Trichogramma pretiosum]
MSYDTPKRSKDDCYTKITLLRQPSIISIMDEVMKSINECNTIRYASYRTACKMQILHRILNMHYVHVELIAAIFERHRLSVTENAVDLDIHEIDDVLSDIYFAAQRESNKNFDIDQTTKLALNFIYKIFNKKEDSHISVISVKTVLTLISCGRLEEKYGYLFHQLADHNACLTKASLKSLLNNICKITELLGETVAYGNHLIPASVDNCFKESQGCLGVTEAEFADWLMQEPPLLMWITTLNRIKSAEQIIHNVKCSSCKTSQIKGPRYLCLKCSSYNLCQNCFLYDKVSSKHKLKHPVREYCTKTSSREVRKLLLELFRNKLRLCPRNVDTTLDDFSGFNLEQTNNFDSMSIRSTMKRRILNDPQKELQSIITRLEDENRQLQIELKGISDTRIEKLQNHRVAIESQLERLKILKNYLFLPGTKRVLQPVNSNLSFIQSTPMVHTAVSRIAALPLEFQLSPIVHYNSSPHYENSDVLNVNEITTQINSCSEQSESTSSNDPDFSSNTQIEPSTWIGGHRTTFDSSDSGFSQWLNNSSNNKNKSDSSNYKGNKNNSEIDNIKKDILPSLRRSDKNSEHSSLQNIQGDLNDILDRLQNMVANDCLLEDTFSEDNNCELKRAATEMEDLLTGLIEGMESRKGKLTTIV